MKRLEVYEGARTAFEHNLDWWEYVRQQCGDAGFDMSKPVTSYFSNETKSIIFTQED